MANILIIDNDKSGIVEDLKDALGSGGNGSRGLHHEVTILTDNTKLDELLQSADGRKSYDLVIIDPEHQISQDTLPFAFTMLKPRRSNTRVIMYSRIDTSQLASNRYQLRPEVHYMGYAQKPDKIVRPVNFSSRLLPLVTQSLPD